MKQVIHQAVITGGDGALAREVANALEAANWRILAPSRNRLDVTDQDSVNRFFHGQQVDLLVCAAGAIRDTPLLRLRESAWDETWAVNFRGSAISAEAVLPGMIERKIGHIIFISSFSALHPPVGQAAYATAKAALLGLTADLAARHGQSNIRVNAVLPGFLQTRMTEAVAKRRRCEILAAHSLGRFNSCLETARFIRFLHHELPHTSGQLFQLDSRVDFAPFS